MNESQEDELGQRELVQNKYKRRSPFDLPEEFEQLERLKQEEAKEQGKSLGAKPDEADKQAVSRSSTAKTRKAKKRSKHYLGLKYQLKYQSNLSLDESIERILKLAKEAFDSSIELHLVTKKPDISGKITLPWGNGKQKRVVVFSETIEKQIQAKKIDFEMMLATKEDMPKIARYAKFLGPKGLMPNPKNKTIVVDPDKSLKQFDNKTITYKTEKKLPLIHLTIGKRSFGKEKLVQNLQAIFKVLNPQLLKKVVLASSMSPSIKVNISSIKNE